MNPTPLRFRKIIDEPTMSDNTLLLKVEDLIGYAFGKNDANVVNFKMLHSILLILATQMRILEQDVEIRFSEEDEIVAKLREAYGVKVVEAAEKTEEEEKVEEEEKGKPFSQQDKQASSKISIDATVTASAQGVDASEGDKAEGSVTRIGSIEVVKPSKFQIMEKMVEELLKRTGGVPLPTLPSNEDLLAELSKGTASLTDTMDAMQVCARVETAEKVISKMAEILTELALSGALPPEVAETIAMIQEDMQQLVLGAAPETLKSNLMGRSMAISETMEKSKPDLEPTVSEIEKVTHPELQDVVDTTREEMKQNLAMLVAKAELTADKANQTANEIEEQVDIAKTLSGRIIKLQYVVNNNIEQLNGFDVGMVAQLRAFDELIGQLRSEQTAGIILLDSINNNAEALALKTLGAGYENLLVELEQDTNAHGGIVVIQKKISDELKGLISCVELLRDEKADRDDVADGLKDKANISRLKGLVKQTTFEETRCDLESHLADSSDKFMKQEQKWMRALKEVNEIIKTKAGVMDMLSVREFTMQSLIEHYEFLRRLEAILGDPQTAMLTRKLSKNAYCGPCVSPALMEIFDKRSGAPPALPALLRHSDVKEAPPNSNIIRAVEDSSKPVCKRWVGGSHTLLTDRVSREHTAIVASDSVPTKQYTGYGLDGRLYLMEDELEPCLECNKLPTAPVIIGGVQFGGVDNP